MDGNLLPSLQPECSTILVARMPMYVCMHCSSKTIHRAMCSTHLQYAIPQLYHMHGNFDSILAFI